MPTVPTYDQAQVAEGGRVRGPSGPSPQSIRARQNQAFGEALVRSGLAVERVADEYDQKQAQAEFYTADAALQTGSQDFTRNARDPSNPGNRLGARAVNVMQDGVADFDARAAKLREGLKSERARQAFDRRVQQSRVSFGDSLGDFQLRQGDAALDTAFKANLQAQINDGVGATTDAELDEARVNLAQSWATRGRQLGLDANTVKVAIRSDLTKIHAAQIKQLADQNPTAAANYYAHYKEQGEIDPTEYRGLDTLLKTAGRVERTQQIVDETQALPLRQGLDYIREHYEGEEREDAIRGLKQYHADNEAARNLSQTQANDAGFSYYLQNKKLPPPSVLAGMDPRTAVSLQNMIEADAKAAASGTAVKTDWNVYEKIITLPPDQLARTDLNPYLAGLSEQDRRFLIKRKADAIEAAQEPKAAADLQTAGQQVDQAMRDLGFTGSTAKLSEKERGARTEQAAQIRKRLWYALEAATPAGKKLDYAQRRAIIDDQLQTITVEGPPTGWSRFSASVRNSFSDTPVTPTPTTSSSRRIDAEQTPEQVQLRGRATAALTLARRKQNLPPPTTAEIDAFVETLSQ